MWYIYTTEYYPVVKKKKLNSAICSNMDGPRDCHTESDNEKPTSYDITYTWNLKKDTNESSRCGPAG